LQILYLAITEIIHRERGPIMWQKIKEKLKEHGGKSAMGKTRKRRNEIVDPTIIAESCGLEGSIETEGTVVVFGSITGKIKCSDLEIWKDGKVYADVVAENVSVGGYFEGEMICNGRLSVSSTGIVTGKVSYRTLSIEPRGLMEGAASRLKSQDTEARPIYQVTGQS
jgi:cytoskeletal protein CcmA (bactofilin family)